MSNLEFIKSMTIEELSKFLGRNCPLVDINICIDKCDDCWKKWLKQEHKMY